MDYLEECRKDDKEELSFEQDMNFDDYRQDERYLRGRISELVEIINFLKEESKKAEAKLATLKETVTQVRDESDPEERWRKMLKLYKVLDSLK